MTTTRTYELVDVLMMRACMDQKLYSQTARALALPKNTGDDIGHKSNHVASPGQIGQTEAGGVNSPIRER